MGRDPDAEGRSTINSPISSTDLDAPELAPGATIGRYRIVEILGRGGMGVVYAAHDPQLDRKVAIKLLATARADEQARLVREAQALAKLAHPNVVAVHDAGTVGEQVFVAMELVEGTTLSRWLDEQPRSWRDVLRVMDQAGQGLAAAHRARLVHRDFKPDNVLIGKDGRARVADFGIARIDDDGAGATAGAKDAAAGAVSTMTEVGMTLGTPAFMAPEQHDAESADASSDQYGFAGTLYFALYGQLAFPRDDLDKLIEAKRAGEVRPAPAGSRVPAWVRRHVVRGLSYRREDRFPSMEELLAALRRDPWVRRRRVAIGAALVAGVAAAALAWPRARAVSPCAPLGPKLAAAWNAQRRATVEHELLAQGGPIAADQAQRVLATLDRRAAEWRGVEQDLCAAPRAQPPLELALRADCLDRYLDDLDSLVGIFEHPEKRVIDRALDIASGMSSATRCADPRIVRLRTPIPAASRAPIIALQRQVALAKAYADAGLTAKGLPIAEEAATEAKALAYKPLEAAALHTLGVLQNANGALEDGAVSERAAALAADLGGDPIIRIHALLDLGWLAWRRHDMSSARQQIEEASALAEELGDASARFDAAGGRVNLDTTWAERIRDQRARVELAESAFGQSRELAGSLWNLVGALDDAGSFDEALADSELMVAVNEAVYGPEHASTASARSQRAIALVWVGRFDDSDAEEARALAIYADRAAAGGDLGQTIFPHLWYAQASILKGRVDVALAAWAAALKLVEEDPKRSAVTQTDALGDMAWIDLLDGRVADARVAIDGALRADPTVGPLPKTMPSLPLAQGEPALAEGKPDEARPLLERTLSELAARKVELEFRSMEMLQDAEAHFGLARALASTDVPAAREHAVTARAKLAEMAPRHLEAPTRLAKQLEDWMATKGW
jgi:tetratricopeptide (TPR) repeat protein